MSAWCLNLPESPLQMERRRLLRGSWTRSRCRIHVGSLPPRPDSAIYRRRDLGEGIYLSGASISSETIRKSPFRPGSLDPEGLNTAALRSLIGCWRSFLPNRNRPGSTGSLGRQQHPPATGFPGQGRFQMRLPCWSD